MRYNNVRKVHCNMKKLTHLFTKSNNNMKTIIEQTFDVAKVVQPRSRMEVLTALTEEYSELAREVLIKEGFSKDKVGEDGIIGEAVDVMTCALDLIYIDNPNVTEEEIMKVVERKLAKWKFKKFDYEKDRQDKDDGGGDGDKE
jgi:hypothetical protein